MVDARIQRYRVAVGEMIRGKFPVEIPIGEEDELGQLGKELFELGLAMKKKFDEINLLSKITEEVNAGLRLDDVLNNVYDSFRPVIPYNRIGCALLEEDGTIVRARWARSDASVLKIVTGYEAPLKGSSLQKIVETRQPRILNDLEAYLKEHPESDSTRKIVQEGMRSSLTCPLIVRGNPIGFIFFSSMQTDTYKDAHIEFFLQIAGHLAIIVEKGRLYQQLLELNELKNKFLGMAAHDLRNPITVIQGYSSLLLHSVAGEIPHSQREIIERIHRASGTMLNLVNDLLDVSAIESGHLELNLEEVNLEAFLRESYESNALLAKDKSIELKLECESNLPKVLMDPNRIEQVINNLITNAIKYSHPETIVTLKAQAQKDKVEISVQDQGQGIPETELPVVFTDFGRTSVKPTAGEKSIGLGLAICKRIVEAHKGRIWVESEPGVGSTFTFTLPIHTPLAPAEKNIG